MVINKSYNTYKAGRSYLRNPGSNLSLDKTIRTGFQRSKRLWTTDCWDTTCFISVVRLIAHPVHFKFGGSTTYNFTHLNGLVKPPVVPVDIGSMSAEHLPETVLLAAMRVARVLGGLVQADEEEAALDLEDQGCVGRVWKHRSNVKWGSGSAPVLEKKTSKQFSALATTTDQIQ
jgi:hypothetical protein